MEHDLIFPSLSASKTLRRLIWRTARFAVQTLAYADLSEVNGLRAEQLKYACVFLKKNDQGEAMDTIEQAKPKLAPDVQKSLAELRRFPLPTCPEGHTYDFQRWCARFNMSVASSLCSLF
jgi:hypothetical protein